ncbi:hypothetical protein Tco_0303242 [Tanacetum coccineum]
MGDKNPPRTLGDYSRPSHEGYKNTIELPDWNNVVPLRSDTIRMAQLGCAFHGLRSKNPNQNLKDFLKLVDSLDLNAIDHSGGGKLHDKSAKESWELIENLALYDHEIQRLMEAHLAPKPFFQVNKIASSCEICGGPHDTQICMENLEQAFIDYAFSRTDETGVLEVLAHAPMYNGILDKYVESLELRKNGSAFIQGEMPKKIKDSGLFTLPCRLGDSNPFDTLANLRSCVNLIPLYLFKTLNVGILEETENTLGLADGTRSYGKRPYVPLTCRKRILATAGAVIDCKRAKIAIGEGVIR